MVSRNPPVLHFNALADPHNSDNAVRPNQDGSINVEIVGGAVTVAAPVYTPVGPSQFGLAVTDALAVALTPPLTARYATIQVLDAAIRYRDDGTNPTTTVGMPIAQNEVFQYAGSLEDIRFICQAGTAHLNVLYYS